MYHALEFTPKALAIYEHGDLHKDDGLNSGYGRCLQSYWR